MKRLAAAEDPRLIQQSYEDALAGVEGEAGAVPAVQVNAPLSLSASLTCACTIAGASEFLPTAASATAGVESTPNSCITIALSASLARRLPLSLAPTELCTGLSGRSDESWPAGEFTSTEVQP